VRALREIISSTSGGLEGGIMSEISDESGIGAFDLAFIHFIPGQFLDF
jgi:hypothetical protein